MKNVFFVFALMVFGIGTCFGEPASAELEVRAISMSKWEWMADKDIKKLDLLFHENSKFVHMSGTWKKKEELDIIESGRIWYKKTDVLDVAAEMFGDTAIVWSRIILVAEVGGNSVSNPFTVTEVYQRLDREWKLLDLTFSKVRDTHAIAH